MIAHSYIRRICFLDFACKENRNFHWIFDNYVFDSTRTLQLLFITGSATLVGTVIYLYLTKLLNVEEVELFYRLVKKIRPKAALKEKKKETSLIKIDTVES